MTPRLRLVVVAIALLGFAWAAFAATDRMYFGPRRRMRADIAEARERVARSDRALDDAARVREEVRGFVARTLGADQEKVDAELRARLNRVAEAVGLEEVAVGTRGASPKRSPARRSFPRGKSWKAMGDEIDFVELRGWISGEGPFEKAVELVDRIDAEPWIKRVDQVRLDPKDDGARYGVAVQLTTLFLPGRALAAPVTAAYEPARLTRFASLVAANPFVLPAAAPPPAPAPAAPPSFPWGDWVLTGVAGRNGVEAWLLNERSRETRALSAGEAIGGAVLASVEGEWAEFRLEGAGFRVRVGQHLNERTVVRD